MRRSGRIRGVAAGICALCAANLCNIQNLIERRFESGSVFCLSTMDLLAKVCLRDTAFLRDIAGAPLPGARTCEPSSAGAQRRGACRRHIPRRTQMEAAGWAPAAGFFANTCASSCLIACNRASGCAAAHASQQRRCPTPSAAVCPLSAVGGPAQRPAIRSVHPPARSGVFVWPPPACPGRSCGGPPDGPPLPICTETIQQEV